MRSERLAVLHKVGRNDLPEGAAQQMEQQAQAPGVGVCWSGSRNSKKAGLPGAEWVLQRVTEMRAGNSRRGSRAFGFYSWWDEKRWESLHRTSEGAGLGFYM